MNKKELVNKIAEETGFTKKAVNETIKAFITATTEGLVADGKVAMVGFGSFTVTERAARKGVNPKTQEKIDIPAKRVPKFKASAALKDAVL